MPWKAREESHSWMRIKMAKRVSQSLVDTEVKCMTSKHRHIPTTQSLPAFTDTGASSHISSARTQNLKYFWHLVTRQWTVESSWATSLLKSYSLTPCNLETDVSCTLRSQRNEFIKWLDIKDDRDDTKWRAVQAKIIKLPTGNCSRFQLPCIIWIVSKKPDDKSESSNQNFGSASLNLSEGCCLNVHFISAEIWMNSMSQV